MLSVNYIFLALVSMRFTFVTKHKDLSNCQIWKIMKIHKLCHLKIISLPIPPWASFFKLNCGVNLENCLDVQPLWDFMKLKLIKFLQPTCDVVSGRLLNKGAITTNNFHQNVDRRSSGGVVGVGTGRSSPRHAGRVDVIVLCLSF